MTRLTQPPHNVLPAATLSARGAWLYCKLLNAESGFLDVSARGLRALAAGSPFSSHEIETELDVLVLFRGWVHVDDQNRARLTAQFRGRR